MTERIADPQAVCPFVALDDDRDFRAPVPDHRHRCFAESPAAPRALAHQAAYCLAGSFPGCPTFVDWARREAAPPRTESPVRSLRDPAGTPRPAPVPPPPVRATEPAPRSASGDWAAPPPWAAPAIGGAAAGVGAAASGPGPSVEASDAFGDAGGMEPPGADLGPEMAAEARPPAAELAVPDDTPAFLAGRSGRSTAPPPPAWVDDDEWRSEGPGPDDEPAAEAPPRRPAVDPRRMPVGYAPVAPAKGKGATGSRLDHVDAAAPSWEQPRRFEAYPTLKSRGGGGIPRVAVYALVILLVGAGLFATPFLLRGLGGGGGTASPTPSASASALASAEPSPTAVSTPAQVIYVVKPNDTLSKIAAKYHVTKDQILAANPSIKDANKIAVGDKIVIPQPAPTVIDNGAITPAP